MAPSIRKTISSTYASDICWAGNRLGCMRSGKFLECIDGNFSTKTIDELTRADSLLALFVTSKEEVVGNVMARAALTAVTVKLWS